MDVTVRFAPASSNGSLGPTGIIDFGILTVDGDPQEFLVQTPPDMYVLEVQADAELDYYLRFEFKPYVFTRIPANTLTLFDVIPEERVFVGLPGARPHQTVKTFESGEYVTDDGEYVTSNEE